MSNLRTALALIGLATFAACSEPVSIDGTRASPTDSANLARAAAVAGKPGTVTNLSAAATSGSAITLSFSQVNDGAGAPAKYDVRFAPAPMQWWNAPSVTNGTCSTPLAGTATSGTLTCTVLGLSPGTKYNFQLVAFRGALNSGATFGALSNVAEATTTTATTPIATTVSIAPTSASIPVGGSQTLVATVRDQNGAVMTCSSLSWTSQNTAVATVNASGSVSGVAAGSTTVTATCAAASGNATVTVTSATVTAPGTVTNLSAAATSGSAITLSFTQVNDGAGAPAKYDVRFAPAPMQWWNAPSVTNGTCSTPLAGTATSGTLTCTVLGLSPGTKYNFQLVAFRGALNSGATFGQLSNVAEATTTTTTTPVATTVSIAPTSASIPVGGSQTFVATVRDQNGAVMTCSSLSWTSQNTAVATVNASGSVTGVATGSTTIRATCAAASATAAVTVTSAPPPPPAGAGDTVFFENWESNSFSKWQDGYKPSTQKINTDAGAYSGSRYLDVTYSSSQDGGWLNTWFMPGYDSLYVRAYVKLSSNWTGGTKFYGLMGNRTDDMWSSFGKAGICPNGTDYFATTVVTEPNGGTSTLTPPVRMYDYFPGMARDPDGTCWGRYGNGLEHYYAPTQISLGVWHKIEMWVRINTVGQSNGLQRVWIDGRLEGEWPGLMVRTSSILKLNALSLMFSSINPASQHLYMDDILVLANKPSP